jgi:hypothetical protein
MTREVLNEDVIVGKATETAEPLIAESSKERLAVINTQYFRTRRRIPQNNFPRQVRIIENYTEAMPYDNHGVKLIGLKAGQFDAACFFTI